jgi:hypothetical protein
MSFAVPFVSAAAGLLLAPHPELDPKAAQSRLEEKTGDLGKPGPDPTFGFGLIQMAGLCERPLEAPVETTHEHPAVVSSGALSIEAP